MLLIYFLKKYISDCICKTSLGVKIRCILTAENKNVTIWIRIASPCIVRIIVLWENPRYAKIALYELLKNICSYLKIRRKSYYCEKYLRLSGQVFKIFLLRGSHYARNCCICTKYCHLCTFKYLKRSYLKTFFWNKKYQPCPCNNFLVTLLNITMNKILCFYSNYLD